MTDKRKSYHWLFRTAVYKTSVDNALKSGLVKTKTEYAVQLWLAYLEVSRFKHSTDVFYAFAWSDTPQGKAWWHRIYTGNCNG